MGLSDSDQAAARRRLEVVQEGLRGLDATASASGADVRTSIVHGAVTAAINELDGAVSLLSAPGETARIPCRFCGRLVMPAATLCGFCWRALSRPASS
jgi:hypothetical protein